MDDKIAALIQRFQQLRGGLRPGNRNAFAGGSSTFREGGRAIPTGPISDGGSYGSRFGGQMPPPGVRPMPLPAPSGDPGWATTDMGMPGGEDGRGIGGWGQIGDFKQRLAPGENPYPPGMGPSANNAMLPGTGWAGPTTGQGNNFVEKDNFWKQLGGTQTAGFTGGNQAQAMMGGGDVRNTLAQIMQRANAQQPVSPWGSGGPMRSRQ